MPRHIHDDIAELAQVAGVYEGLQGETFGRESGLMDRVPPEIDRFFYLWLIDGSFCRAVWWYWGPFSVLSLNTYVTPAKIVAAAQPFCLVHFSTDVIFAGMTPFRNPRPQNRCTKIGHMWARLRTLV
jgi:hypothetical protein